MPTYIDAVESTNNQVSGFRKRDVDEKIYMLEPDSNPLTRFLTASKDMQRKVTDPKFEHHSTEPVSWWTTVNSAAGFSTSASVIKVADATMYRPDDLVKNATTGEVLGYVASVTTTHITLSSRGSFETARAAITNGDYILRLGSAKTEASTSGTPKIVQYTNNYNFTEIFLDEWGWSRTQLQTGTFGPDKKRQRRLEKSIDHALSIERQFLWGERAELGSNDSPRRTTRGLDKFITTNDINVAGPLTEDAFRRDILRVAGRYGSGEKLFLASPLIISVMESWGSAKMRYDDKMSGTLGFKVERYTSAHVDLMVVRHKLFEQGYADRGYIVDPAAVRYAYLLQTKLWENIQANDYDGEKHALLTEAGLDLMNEKWHVKIRGVAA